jgi:DNA-directed RNA polymerase subunit RPC12/RpoP
MFDNEKKRGCKYCWQELALAIGIGNTRCGHCGKTPAESRVEKKRNKRPLKKCESERHIDINLRDEKDGVIIGLRPLVGDYWGEPVKTRQNPHALGFGDRYCGIHEKPMTEGFRKGIDNGRHIFKCEDCDFHNLLPPKTKMDWKQVKEVLKPYHHLQ